MGSKLIDCGNCLYVISNDKVRSLEGVHGDILNFNGVHSNFNFRKICTLPIKKITFDKSFQACQRLEKILSVFHWLEFCNFHMYNLNF